MTRPRTPDSEGDEYIQFRGAQTSVSVDQFGVHFGTERRNGRIAHEPLPVVEDDAADPPQNAVARSVAELLVDSNPMVAFGVACEHPDCDQVFATPQGVNSHQSAHQDGSGADDEGA